MFNKSQNQLIETLKLIPLASQTFSKSHIQYPENAAPLFAEKGRGAHLFDVDGNEYIDFVNGLNCVVLGYCDPDVYRAVKVQLEKGSILTLPTELEMMLAKKLVELIPCAEMVRFGKNGSDVTAGAIRLARAYTGRERVACCGYHGWQDWYIGSTTRNKGIPKVVCELTHPFKYNDIGSLSDILESYPKEFAAVIMEPTHLEPPDKDFLQNVKDLAHHHGALLVFDEIITGFRWHLGGAQTYYQVIPDLATFGKGMANGFPISAVVGRRELMKEMEEIFFSLTFGGEALSLAAALATIKKMEKEPVIHDLWKIGEVVLSGTKERLNANALDGAIELMGAPPWSVFVFKDTGNATELEIKSYFLQEVLKRNILTLGGHTISYAHTRKDIDQLLSVYDDVFPLIGQALERGNIREQLIGNPIEPLFKVR